MRNLFNMDSPLFRALGKLADLMVLNIVFLLCCLPVFTIGAALTGLNYVTLKMAQDEESYIARSFFKSFKQNFKQATAIWLIALAVGIVLILDLVIMWNATGTFATVIRIAVVVTIIIYAMVMLYVFPVLSRFYNTVKATIRNSFIIAVANFPKTLLMLAIPVAAVIVTLFNSYTLVYGLLIWLMFGFALVSFATSFFMKKILAKYMPKEEEEDEKDPDSWDVDETMGPAPKAEAEADPAMQAETAEITEAEGEPALEDRFEIRAVRADEADETAQIEQICFPPNEACSEEQMKARVKLAPEVFLVAADRATGRIAGFLNGLATDEEVFRDAFFEDASLHRPAGKNVMLLGLDVRPEYRRQGLGRALMQHYQERERAGGRTRLILTCLDDKVAMYEKMGFRDLGLSASVWGGEQWHDMDCLLNKEAAVSAPDGRL